MCTTRQADKALERAGYGEQVVYNHSGAYYYFFGGDSHAWHTTIIGGTPTLRGMSAEEVVALRNTLATANR